MEYGKDEVEQFGTSLRMVAKTSFIVFIGIFVSKLFTYIYRIIVAREFGPETYGVFSLAIVISGWFIAISALGLSEGLLRYIPLYRAKNDVNRVRYVFKIALVTLTISSIIAGAILFFCSEFIALTIFKNQDLIFFLKVSSIIVPATLISSPFLGTIRAYEKISLHSLIFNIFQMLTKTMLLIILIIIGLGKDAIIISYTLGMIALLAFSYLACKYTIPEVFEKVKLNKKQKRKVRVQLFNYSIPLLFSSFILILFYWIDTFSIGYYKSAIEVGFYNAAVPIAMLLAITPELFMQLFYPLINKEYSRGNNVLIKELSKQVTKWIFVINLPIFILLIMFPGAALNILFGPEYLVAENALRILVVGSLISSVFIVSTQLISMIGKSKLVLLNMTLAFVLNFLLNSVLVPMERIWFIENSAGINGAAIATVISILFLNALFFIQSKKYLQFIFLRRKMLNIFLASIIPLASLIYLKELIQINMLSLTLMVIIFGIFYIALVILFGGLDKNDFMIINSMKNRFFKGIGKFKSG